MRGRLSRGVLALGIGWGVAACQVDAPAFICTTNEECNLAGYCEAQGVCSTMDPSCAPSNRRYAPSAGDLAELCVPGGPADDTGPVPSEGGRCSEAGDCDDGYCEASGWCSFPASVCASGRIYGRSDDATLQGECVAPHSCNATFTDTFQENALDTKFWRVLAFGGAKESWLDVAASSLRFRFPIGAFEENQLYLETVDIADMTASEVVVRVATPPSEGFSIEMTVQSTVANGIAVADAVYAVMFSDRIVFGTGFDSKTVDIDYAENEYLGIVINTSDAALVGGPDKDDLVRLASFEHDLDLSRARTYLQASIPVTGQTEELRRAEFASIQICSIE